MKVKKTGDRVLMGASHPNLVCQCAPLVPKCPQSDAKSSTQSTRNESVQVKDSPRSVLFGREEERKRTRCPYQLSAESESCAVLLASSRSMYMSEMMTVSMLS